MFVCCLPLAERLFCVRFKGGRRTVLSRLRVSFRPCRRHEFQTCGDEISLQCLIVMMRIFVSKSNDLTWVLDFWVLLNSIFVTRFSLFYYHRRPKRIVTLSPQFPLIIAYYPQIILNVLCNLRYYYVSCHAVNDSMINTFFLMFTRLHVRGDYLHINLPSV